MRKPARSPAGLSVAVIAFDGISPFHLSVPCLVFGEHRDEDGIPANTVWVCSEQPGRLNTTAGFAIDAPHGLERLAQADIVIVPSWSDTMEPASPALTAALRRAHARGAQLVGLCLGAFVLADTGLLDGHRATTHWIAAPRFAQRYPKVKLDPNALYIDDGKLCTSAGTAASLDCCLHLLRQRIGAERTNRIARRLVISPHRQGGQAQFIEQPMPARHDGDRLSETMVWAQGHLDEPLNLDLLADRALMSRRTFTRRFRAHTGTSFVDWLIAQRLAHAQRLLETTDQPIEVVAATVGFGSALSLRQHFTERLHTTPSAYRREFRGPQAA